MSKADSRRSVEPAPLAGENPDAQAFPWFAAMVDHCYAYAEAAQAAGRPIVGIMCEYTPRELILAAGGIPVCLCGGDAALIPAAEADLPANLCPLIKSTYGYHQTRSNPFLEWASLLVAETTCDGKKKMYELLAQTRPMYVLELPQKSDDPDAFAHWCCEIRKLQVELERRFGVEITSARLREAVLVMNRERALRRQLAGFMRAAAPPLTGRQLLDLKSLISGMPDLLAALAATVAKLASSPPRPEGQRPIRVLLTGVPVVHGAERVVDLIEDHGGLIVAMENCTGLKPIMTDIDPDAPDLLQALAEHYWHLPCSVMTPNHGRLDLLRQLTEEYRPDCVIELIWQACLTYEVESVRIRRLAEDELGLPYLRISTDYAPSDSARLTVRIEALYETVRARRK